MKKISAPTSPGQREELELLPDPEHNLSVAEVRLLWSFLHGDIMIGETRQRLRKSWGLCPRHAWAHAVVEIELWQAGAGERAGHQPFDVGILYEDLLETIVHQLKRTHARSRVGVLTSRGTCSICKDLHTQSIAGLDGGYAGSNSEALTAEANLLTHVRAWFTQTRPVWRICPACADKFPGADGITGQLCRGHILERGSLDDEQNRRLISDLTDTRQLLLPLIDSMTQFGCPSTAAEDASWIQALGWFDGWAFPLFLSPLPQNTES
jgi:hypothetical protein